MWYFNLKYFLCPIICNLLCAVISVYEMDVFLFCRGKRNIHMFCRSCFTSRLFLEIFYAPYVSLECKCLINQLDKPVLCILNAHDLQKRLWNYLLFPLMKALRLRPGSVGYMPLTGCKQAKQVKLIKAGNLSSFTFTVIKVSAIALHYWPQIITCDIFFASWFVTCW